MSAISSQLSFRSSRSWKLNARVFNIMDSIYAVAFGLGLRTLVDAVSQDLKLTGSLIGLWEGVITLHFLKKMPKSSDPYIAYGVRLFIDFLATESIERLVLVLIWTAFGMVLADVTPAIWEEVGLKRVWRHFRRDLYTIYDRIPTVAFFPPQRTVRFLPPRQREREREPSIITPSIATSQGTPITVIPPSSSVPSDSIKHRVPGYYPGDYSDTDTDSRSRIRRSPRTEVDDALGTTHHRLSTIPKLNRTYSAFDSDDGIQSSAVSSPSSGHGDIPDMEEEEEVPVDVVIEEEEQALPDPNSTTPKQKAIPMPPTPSDSAARWDIHRDVVEDVSHPKPPCRDLPNIPDSGEDGGTSDGWEKIHRRELDEEIPLTPPTPPAKDRPVGGGSNVPISIQIPLFPPTIPPVAPLTTSMDSLDYSALESFSIPQVPSAITENRRESVPPPYTSHMDDFEDMYYNPPPKQSADADDHANINEPVENNDNGDDNEFTKMSLRQAGNSDINTGASANPWAVPDASAQARADAATEEENAKKQADEAAERGRKEKEEERMRQAEADIIRQREEESLRKEMEEKLRKEAEEKQRKEAEERERIRIEEEQKQQEAERLKAQQAEDARREKEAEMKRKADLLAEIKKKEEDDNALRKQKQAAEKKKEEAERERKAAEKKKEEEAAKKEEEAEQMRKAAEKEEEAKRQEAEQKRKDEAEQEKKEEEAKKKEEIAEQKTQDEDTDVLKRETEENEQETRDTVEKQGANHASKEAEEVEKIETEQAEPDKLEPDAPGDQATQEKEDDSKTLHGVEFSNGQHQHEQGPSETDNAQVPTASPHGDPMEEESVVSTATTDLPQEVKVRLERMMILRAQMVEVEKRLDELEAKGLDENSAEMKAAEKVLRKYRRQADRRYAAGMLFLKFHVFHS